MEIITLTEADAKDLSECRMGLFREANRLAKKLAKGDGTPADAELLAHLTKGPYPSFDFWGPYRAGAYRIATKYTTTQKGGD